MNTDMLSINSILDSTYDTININNDNNDIIYDLNNIRGGEGNHAILSIIKDKNGNEKDDYEKILNTLKLYIKTWNYKNNNYKIIKYDKEYLSNDLIKSSGLFRSVIINSNNEIVVFSPPKSLNDVEFQKMYQPSECISEEFIEGTMINMFYSNNEWEIATKSSVGGKTYYFQQDEKLTFRHMFLDACNKMNFDFDTCLNKDYCYSFVLQHPKNRIVSPIDKPCIYLIKVYKINGYKIIEQDRNEHYNLYLLESNLLMPNRDKFNSYKELKERYASMNTPYEIVGIMIYSENGDRTKFRNPNYEDIKKLRGNQPKLQYQYLSLRQSGEMSQFIKYFPEYKSKFYEFRNHLHRFTTTLYKNYVNCYINKEKPLLEFNYEYRNCMYSLHQLYLNDLKPNSKHIDFKYVVDYVNKMHPSQLMFLLNYNYRKNNLYILDQTKTDNK
jgi:hypothetical protein